MTETDPKDNYVLASFSGGKDSTAMVLNMLELGEQLDEVVNIDTGMEFPAMYEHIERVRAFIESKGVKFTTLRAPHSFEWYMFEKEVQSKKYGLTYGYGWPGPHMRWCTKHLKTELMGKYAGNLRKNYKLTQCIGLAADEIKRLERPNNKNPAHRHPLVEWGWTEKDCLEYCYSLGYDWGGLYKIFNRVSCWCCPLARLSELKQLYKNYPELWDRLLKMDARLKNDDVRHYSQPFSINYPLEQLNKRFAREVYAEKCQTELTRFFDYQGGED